MKPRPDNEIINSRVLNYPIEIVYEAFSNPLYLKNWWGPDGFTNTIHEFNLKPGGKWILTMHGPEKGNYENSSVFNKVEPLRLVSWTRHSQPYFDMEIHFEEISKSSSKITFRMIFETKKECDKIINYAGPKNEENFDRLDREIKSMLNKRNY